MDTSFPRVSVLLLAYNQVSTVRRAAQSVLAQECEPLEIVLSDDASTDGTLEVLRELERNYVGPHRVWLRHNERNVGIGEHYNQLIAASHGQLLVTAAGDDWSEPHRVRRLIEAWDATGGKADLIASHVMDLDHEGVLHDVLRVDDLSQWRSGAQWLNDRPLRPYIIGAGHAFTRRMMERFGPLLPEIFYEDQIMVFRAVSGGGAVTIDEALVHYRRGGTSRRPRFESPEHMAWWTDRQLGRELAEMEQIIQDSALAGCESLARQKYEHTARRSRFLRRIKKARTHEERWAAFKQAAGLPTWWRFRKMLHAAFPRATWVVKRGLSVFHRRQH